jgi:hypothetical protein
MQTSWREERGRVIPGLLGLLFGLGGLAAIGIPVWSAAMRGAGYQPVKAFCIAAGVMLVITAFTMLAIRKQRIAQRPLEWTDIADTTHEIAKGWIVPTAALTKLQELGAQPGAQVVDADTAAPERGVSVLRTLYQGKDNRASTSKAVAPAWT